MKAEIITIGDEILIGQVIDSNSAWMANELNLIGIAVKQVTSISDNKDHIMKAMDNAITRADIILMTGGLGPTKDDITKQTLCEYFDTHLVLNEDSFSNVKRIFESRGVNVTELNKAQAELPANCTPLENKFGTASGMWFETKGKLFVSMPGVPYEMRAIMTDHVIPKLKYHFNPPAIVHKTVMTTGIGESFIADKIAGFENNLPDHIKLAYLPKPGIVRLRFSGTGNNKDQLQKEINEKISELVQLIPKYVYGFDNEPLEKVIGELLLKCKTTLSTAESCTGGYIAHLITSIPGSSNYFKGSIVSYSNEVKAGLLGVSADTLEQQGAVSEQTVTEMAQAVRSKLKTDFSISCSGIAGPDGGTEDKPVGTVWIAVASEKEIKTQHFLFNDNRERNIQRTAYSSLNMLRKMLLK